MLSGRTLIGLKRMGEIDTKPFQTICKGRFKSSEAEVKAFELCSLWQERMKNPDWHPYKIVMLEGGNHQVCHSDFDISTSCVSALAFGLFNLTVTVF